MNRLRRVISVLCMCIEKADATQAGAFERVFNDAVSIGTASEDKYPVSAADTTYGMWLGDAI